VKDLSDLAAGYSGLTGNSSMQATNMVSAPPLCGAPGSESEATAGIIPGTPGPAELPAADINELTNFDVHENPADPYILDATVPGSRWTVAPNEDTPARGGVGPWKRPAG
jgi:hypothetical protein